MTVWVILTIGAMLVVAYVLGYLMGWSAGQENVLLEKSKAYEQGRLEGYQLCREDTLMTIQELNSKGRGAKG